MRDTAIQALRDLARARHHPPEVDAWRREVEAQRRRATDMTQCVRGVKQRLGGNAAPVQTDSAEMLLLDKHDFQAELSAAQCGDVSTGAAANHYEIECIVFGHHVTSSARGCSR